MATGQPRSSADWKTLLDLRTGTGRNTDPLELVEFLRPRDFSNVYSATYSNYCGYYALDITNTASPVYKWRIAPTASQAPYLGDPWSKMMVSRLKVGGVEKWVGFIGGGHNYSSCTGTDCDNRGKGFFIIDLSNGNVLWSYTKANDSNMAYAMPGTPTVVDTDGDGLIDLIYMGDLGGNIWRFTLCSASSGSSCGTSNWAASRLFSRGTGNGPVYDAPAVSRDTDSNLWVYWGTGDKAEPIVVGTNTDKFFAVKDATLSGTYTTGNLENITSGTYTDSSSKRGWYVTLSGAGEKNHLRSQHLFRHGLLHNVHASHQRQRPLQPGGHGKTLRRLLP